MLSDVGIMIAVFGAARLLNDCFARYNDAYYTAWTWKVSLIAIAVLSLLAIFMNVE